MWRALILLLVLLAVYLAGRAICAEVRKSRLYAAGEAASECSEALVQFSALVELDPDYRDARERLNEAIYRAVEVVPGGSDLAAEIVLLRWLAASGDRATLAEVLDRCVVTVPAGEFLMGNDAGPEDERPQRLVYLDAFEIDRYEVTNVQYRRFLQATGRKPPPHWSGDEYPAGQAGVPVVGVTWEEAGAYCAWTGRRLPTEAEWEKACRGATGRVYPWGDTWYPDRANVISFEGDPSHPTGHTEPGAMAWGDDWTSLRMTPTGPGAPGLRPVGSYPEGVSPYGVMDLAGSVSEWVADWYNWNGYWNVPDRNPVGLGPEWNRSMRGSSWYPYGAVDLARERSPCSARNSSHHSVPDARVGFRCARSLLQ